MTVRWCFLLVFAYVCLAIWYADVTPNRQPGVLLMQRTAKGQPLPVADIGAPDERQHVNYVDGLLSGFGFPVLVPGDGENYQAHQPPLYYVLGTVVCMAQGAEKQEDLTPGLRYLNVFLGALTLCAVFVGARYALQNDSLALAAVALTGFMPMFLALHGAASNDPLLICLCSWVFALCCRGFRQGFSVKLCLSIGILMGLAALTKTTALALFVVVGAAMLIDWKALSSARLKYAAAILIPAIAIPMAWWVRNMKLYGDPFAIGAFNKAFAGSPKASFFIENLGATHYWGQMVGWWTLRSGIGVFGYMDLFLPQWIYVVGILSLLVLFLGGFFGWSRLERSEENLATRKCLNLALVLMGVVLLLFVQFNSTYFQGQARYLFPAVAGSSIWCAFGLRKLGPWATKYGWAVIAILLVALNVYVAGSFLPAQFALRMGQ